MNILTVFLGNRLMPSSVPDQNYFLKRSNSSRNPVWMYSVLKTLEWEKAYFIFTNGVLCYQFPNEHLKSKTYHSVVRHIAIYFQPTIKRYERRLAIMNTKMLRWTSGVNTSLSHSKWEHTQSLKNCGIGVFDAMIM